MLYFTAYLTLGLVYCLALCAAAAAATEKRA
jgi:hypothetical protein